MRRIKLLALRVQFCLHDPSFGGSLLELGLAIGESNIKFLCSLNDDLPTLLILDKDACNDRLMIVCYLFFAETDWAISPAYDLLFMRSNSISFSFLMRNFLKPEGSKCLVFAADLDPILGNF